MSTEKKKGLDFLDTSGEVHKNWRGCKNIDMLYFNNWADPSLLYDGYEFNYWDVEDALYSMLSEDLEEEGKDINELPQTEVDKMFNKLCQEYGEYYLEELIDCGYFEDGSKSWRTK